MPLSRHRVSCILSWSLVASAGLAPGLTAQLVLPAEGQPPFDGSCWNHGGLTSLAADLNADGFPDLIVASSLVATALNNGHGVFQPVASVSVAELSDSSTCGDLDGDGSVDVVVGSRTGSGSMTTLAGDGAGRLTVTQSLAVIDPGTLDVGDFDLDGRLDVVAGSTVAAFAFQTLPGLGDGTLAAPIAQGPGSGFHSSVDVADWDLDGDPDVLAGSPQSVVEFRNDGTGSFSIGTNSTEDVGGAVRVGDIDADGWPDALNTFSWLGQPYVAFRHSNAGFFAGPVATGVPSTAELVIEEAPADGFPDVLAGGNPGLARLVYNAGGYLSVAGTITHEHGVEDLAFVDVDGDTDSDPVVFGGDGATVYFLDSNGKAGKPKHFALPAGSVFVASMVLANLDGDARPDIVVVDRDTDEVHVAKGKSSGLAGGVPFGAWLGQATQPGPIDVAVVDANADGNDDVVVLCAPLSPVRHIATHLGSGTTTPGQAVVTDFGNSPLVFALGDLDADSVPDAVVLESTVATTLLQARLGTGTGAFSPAGQAALGTNGARVALGDVDGDGLLDAVATRSSDELLVCRGDGAGNLAAPVLVPQSVGVFRDVLVSDFDGDGRQDLAASCLNGGGVAVFRNDGAGGFDAPAVGGFPNQDERGLIAADIDDDGALDLAHAGFFDAAVYVVRGDGHGGLLSATAHPGAEGGGIRTLAAADANLDGLTDLLQLGSADDELVYFARKASADNAWASIGGGIRGAAGQPRAVGTGEPVAGQVLHLDFDHVLPGAPTTLLLGFSLLDVPFKGGRLVPSVDLVLTLLPADVAGQVHLASPWPEGIPSGLELWYQGFFADASAAHGLSASGGLRLRVP